MRKKRFKKRINRKIPLIVMVTLMILVSFMNSMQILAEVGNGVVTEIGEAYNQVLDVRKLEFDREDTPDIANISNNEVTDVIMEDKIVEDSPTIGDEQLNQVTDADELELDDDTDEEKENIEENNEPNNPTENPGEEKQEEGLNPYLGQLNPDARADTINSIFPDPNLAQVVAEHLGKQAGDFVTDAELQSIEILDAENRGIRYLQGVNYLRNLTTIYLSNNNIHFNDQESADALRYAESLLYIDLTENQIDLIPIIVGHFNNNNWKSLLLGANNISGHVLIANFSPTITLLDLSRNNINSLSRLDGLPNLQRLRLSDNNITSLPTGLGSLPALRLLNLDNNNITTLAGRLDEFPQLAFLSLSNNNIENLSSYMDLPNLINLNLSGNNISDIPMDFGTLPKLEVLNLSNNNLIEVNTSATNDIPTLRNLNMENNNIINFIGTDLMELPNLEALNLANNNLQSISVAMGYLPNLEHLVLNNNDISTLPSNWPFLPSLKILELNNNNITDFIGNINLPELIDLRLANNSIIDFPGNLGNLPDLERLNLNNNNIQDIPDFVADYQGLVELHLNNNRISDLRPLASLNEAHIQAKEQTILLDAVEVGIPTDFNLYHIDGTIPDVSIIDGKHEDGQLIWNIAGENSGTWSGSNFNGTVRQTVYPGTMLMFENVPNTLKFEETPIQTDMTTIKRKDADWSLSVRDTRGDGSTWRVYASISSPLTSEDGQHSLPDDALVFKNSNGEIQPLSNELGMVYSGLTSKGSFTTRVSWKEDEGILIRMRPIDARVDTHYQTTITWTLTDAPL